MEEWKDIPNYEGRYQISSHGRLKSLPRTEIRSNGNPLPVKEKFLAQSNHPKGYKYINLKRETGSIKEVFKVHRLVAQAFVQNEGNLPQVNHIDGDKANNFASNLEWVSNRENCTHKFFNKKKASKYPGVSFDKRRSKWRVIMQINGLLKNYGSFSSEEDAYMRSLQVLSDHGIENKYSKVA